MEKTKYDMNYSTTIPDIVISSSSSDSEDSVCLETVSKPEPVVISLDSDEEMVSEDAETHSENNNDIKTSRSENKLYSCTVLKERLERYIKNKNVSSKDIDLSKASLCHATRLANLQKTIERNTLRPASKEDNMLSKAIFAERMANLRRLVKKYPSSTVTSSLQGDDETFVEQRLAEKYPSSTVTSSSQGDDETFVEQRLAEKYPSSTVTSSSQGDEEQNNERKSKRRENDEFDENKSKRVKYNEGFSSDIEINISQEGDQNPVNESHPPVDTTNKKKNKKKKKPKNDLSKMRQEVYTEVNKRLKNHDTSGLSKEEFEKSKYMRAPSNWTEEMKSFYFDPIPANRKMNLEDMQSKMSDSSNWEVDAAEYHSKIVARNKGRYMGGRSQNCSNCNSYIHDTANCPLPDQRKNKIRCHICGKTGHYANRCPKICCLNCGGPSESWTYKCSRCKSQYNIKCGRCKWRGHATQQCSDHWRQFHHTVVPGPPKPVRADRKHWSELYCSNCARQGHIYDDCRNYSYNRYPKMPSKVSKYDKDVAIPEQPQDVKPVLINNNSVSESSTEQHENPKPKKEVKEVLPKILSRRVKRLNEQLRYALAIFRRPPEYFEREVVYVLEHLNVKGKYSSRLQASMQYVSIYLVALYDVDGGKKKLVEFKDLSVQVSEMTQEFVSEELLQTLQGYYDLIFSANCEILDIVKLFQKFLIKNPRFNTPLIQKLMGEYKVPELTGL